MDGAGQIHPESRNNGAGVARDYQELITSSYITNSTDGRHIPRKPSALQVSVSAAATNDPAQSSMRSPKSPTPLRSFSDSSHSSPGPSRPSVPNHMESPKSPRERLDDFLKQEDPQLDNVMRSEEASKLRGASASPSKVQSYSQLRKISSPLPDTRPLGNSSPPSPRSTASPPLIGSSLRPEGRQMPRTSSIDSAISSMSPATTHSPNGSLDSTSTTSTEVSHLIKTAGSAEAVIQHLLNEKQQKDARVSQLWTMVEKQRRLILGLNQDLEKAAKDRERYRRQLKGYRNMIPPVPNAMNVASEPMHRGTSRSPAPSDGSAELPIQKQNLENPMSSAAQEEAQTPRPGHSNKFEGHSHTEELAPAAVPESIQGIKSEGRTTVSHHSHKHTSSSDIGVFNLSKTIQDIPPLQTSNLDHTTQNDRLDCPPQISPPLGPGMSPTSSFTAKRSHPYSTKPFSGPSLMLTESTPPGNDMERMTPPRKAPPAPLDLGQPRAEPPLSPLSRTHDDHSASEYEDEVEVDELPAFDRGRKKTREEDDQEREILLQKEQEERSRSKKDKKSKSRSGSKKKTPDAEVAIKSQAVPMPPSIKALAPEPTPALSSTFLSQPASLAGMLNPMAPQKGSEITQQTITAKPPKSPGLPLSPRPSDRPENAPIPRLPRDAANAVASPPLSPRPGFVGLPLSPRAPRQTVPPPAFPPPPYTPMSMAPSSPIRATTESRSDSPHILQGSSSPGKSHQPSDNSMVDSDSTKSTGQLSNGNKSKSIFKGFISEAYPGLLIPPNALPSIKVTVVSSRLKPSRYSMVLKGTDEEPVFILGVSARFDQRDLWQVEKPILSLHHLDQQLRQSSRFDVKLPDRSLFSGHAPAKVDARRVALERYFETILDTQMDEKAAVALCQYLSTNASEPGNNDTKSIVDPGSPTMPTSTGQVTKEGYLTKRGKNFGGWKSRFFMLDEPTLRYYETPGGTLLGTIKLLHAQIGRQSPAKPTGSGDEGDSQYRHAFLIREPKRKDPNIFTDHVLCAESDSERDAWVDALLEYINPQDSRTKARPTLEKNNSSSSRMTLPVKNNTVKQNGATKESPDSEDFDSLQAVPYEETRPAQPPHVRITPDPRPDESPSPTTPGSQPSERAPSAVSKPISGPQNGTKISDAGAWGNKPMASPVPVQREHKKRSLFGFHNKDTSHLGAHHPNGSDLSLTQQQYQEQITNVKAAFGAPLADAVEYCPPKVMGEVCLPAVVYRCIQYLEAKNAAMEEGIFRMSGSTTLIKNLKNRFNAEGDFDLLATGQHYDIHAVASLLKQYLRDLPAMILTRELHMKFLAVLGMQAMNTSILTNADGRTELDDDRQKPAAFNFLVHQLPKPNFHLLKALSGFLVTVVNNCEVNKMDNRNVGIVFSPTLNIPTPVILMFLTNFGCIFGDPLDESNGPIFEPPTSQALTPDDIRSPRRQMFSDLPTPAYNQTSFVSNQQISREEKLANGLSTQQDLGFAPLQPAYEAATFTPQPSSHETNSITVPGPEYAVARPRNLAPGGGAKQSRRESSMLLMSPGQRKSSLPMMRVEQG